MSRLMRFAVAEAKLKVRVSRAAKEASAAMQDFIAAVKADAPRPIIEAARLRCTSVYETQLDIIIEAHRVEHDWIEEERREREG